MWSRPLFQEPGEALAGVPPLQRKNLRHRAGVTRGDPGTQLWPCPAWTRAAAAEASDQCPQYEALRGPRAPHPRGSCLCVSSGQRRQLTPSARFLPSRRGPVHWHHFQALPPLPLLVPLSQMPLFPAPVQGPLRPRPPGQHVTHHL